MTLKRNTGVFQVPMRRQTQRLLLGALLAFASSACDSGRLLSPSAQTIKELVAARALWNAQGYSNYEFTLVRSCFCPDRDPMHVTVANGVVVGVRREANLLVLIPEAEWSWYPSIERIFAITAEELARPAAMVKAEFDRVLGYPHSIYIDQSYNIADEEFGYAVTNVRVK